MKKEELLTAILVVSNVVIVITLLDLFEGKPVGPTDVGGMIIGGIVGVMISIAVTRALSKRRLKTEREAETRG